MHDEGDFFSPKCFYSKHNCSNMLPKKYKHERSGKINREIRNSCDSEPSHFNILGVAKASIISKVKIKDQS